MSIDDLIPPEDDQVIVTKNGVVITSIDSLMRWTDDWMKVVELRRMLSNRKVKKWIDQSESGDTPSGKKGTRR